MINWTKYISAFFVIMCSTAVVALLMTAEVDSAIRWGAIILNAVAVYLNSKVFLREYKEHKIT